MSCTMQKRPTRTRALAGFALCRRFQHPSTVPTMYSVLILAVNQPQPPLRKLYIIVFPLIFYLCTTTILFYNISTARHRNHDRSFYKIPRSCQLTQMRLAPLTARSHRYRDFLPLRAGKKKSYSSLYTINSATRQ
ncbi:uncharacterized protein ASPGLDRAFT_1026103 [Aspergillus glaucus CBS 516.65]|uniref:Uncharacterized protein n=1 Tax=Aspergillus glaucus CBS 516.65 TaxID=1160497 RepID=A0A1L9VVY4_ASPGL|nr:hypothetical protein ASPGLDRAFT_1026103 [Aspergillus glaucus CBS 516.65]OJJ88072.1 hypothetical protein ASPGLDRAFT_1026103 [Aspergillus glaucus CBS 516.65]